jgi:acyl-CoA synthetase (AMP-forming)/AMP-acid ligase II
VLAFSDAANRLASEAGPPNMPESSFATNDPLPKNEARRDYSTFQQANFVGYRRRPENTARTLRGEWIYTGDG